MSEIPPKQMPDTSSYDETGAGGGMVAMYTAASHANAESFPVLKAFQDYLEAERTQARKRVIQLSVFYAILMGVVVTGFLIAGGFMVRNMSSMQDKLLDIALASRAAPVPAQVAPAAPAIDESAKQLSRVATELQSHLDKKLDGVNDIANKVNDKVASQDGELEKLRGELRQMQEQSAQLKNDLVAIKTEAQHPVSTFRPSAANFTPIAPRPTPSTAASAAAPAPLVTAQPSVAVAPIPAAPEKPQPIESNFPAAVKEPPSTPTGVTPPLPPQGMMATAIPLKTKNVGTVPWRVLIPE